MAKFDNLDDGRAWGWIENGTWREIPKVTLMLGGFGPPPFDVTLLSGELRHIVHNPNGDDAPITVEPVEGFHGGVEVVDETPIAADLFPEDALPAFHVMRQEGDTEEGWEITSMEVAAALGLAWPLT
jgi:hypothetical protein